MKDQIKEVRDKLANKDSMDPEEIKKTVNELQQQSLKLFEMAYKKVRRSVLLLFSIDRIGSLSQCTLDLSEFNVNVMTQNNGTHTPTLSL